MAKKVKTETTATKKASTKPAKLDRKGDPDIDVARARSLDGDTANDPADEGVKTTAEKAGVEADGEDDAAPSSTGDDEEERARKSPTGHADNEHRLNSGTRLEGGSYEVLSYLMGEETELSRPRKSGGVVVLRDADGEEYEFIVHNESTARHIANVFSAAGDELARRSM